MIRLGMMLLIPLFFLGCSEPKVEVYGKPGAAEQILDPGVGNLDPGVGNLDPGEFSAFAGVATPAKTICASCHSATPIGGQKLSSNSDSQNRQILLAYKRRPRLPKFLRILNRQNLRSQMLRRRRKK